MVKTRSEKKRKSDSNHLDRMVKKTRTVNTMPKYLRCPCGGGQSCIIDRRWVGDWVHEDDVFRANGLPIRKWCNVPYTKEQKLALHNTMNTD